MTLRQRAEQAAREAYERGLTAGLHRDPRSADAAEISRIADAIVLVARDFAEQACIEHGRLGVISRGMSPAGRVAAAIAEAEKP